MFLQREWGPVADLVAGWSDLLGLGAVAPVQLWVVTVFAPPLLQCDVSWDQAIENLCPASLDPDLLCVLCFVSSHIHDPLGEGPNLLPDKLSL